MHSFTLTQCLCSSPPYVAWFYVWQEHHFITGQNYKEGPFWNLGVSSTTWKHSASMPEVYITEAQREIWCCKGCGREKQRRHSSYVKEKKTFSLKDDYDLFQTYISIALTVFLHTVSWWETLVWTIDKQKQLTGTPVLFRLLYGSGHLILNGRLADTLSDFNHRNLCHRNIKGQWKGLWNQSALRTLMWAGLPGACKCHLPHTFPTCDCQWPLILIYPGHSPTGAR